MNARLAAQSPALTVARSRAAVLEELRRLLPRLESSRQAAALPFGLAAIDSHLPQGGLACGALHEIVPEPRAMPAGFGFITALLSRLVHSPPPCGEGLGVGVERFCAGIHALTSPRYPPPYPPPTSLHSGAHKRGPGGGRVFLVMPNYGLRDYGRLYGHGLRTLGLDPARLILVETAHRRDTLWALEEALRSGAPAAVAGFIDKLDLKTSQRLHLAAVDAGLPLLLLQPPASAAGGGEHGSAAATRWRVGAAKAARDRFGFIAHPRWRLQLERARNGRPGEWIVEYDHVAHRFSLAAALADPALSCGAGEKADRKSRCA